jgi:hypothetical protein
MQFDQWYREEWTPRYHPRLYEAEKVATKAAIDIEIEQGRVTEVRREVYDYGKRFEEFKVKMVGNGEKGYVDRVVDEAVDDLKKELIQTIKNSIREAFEEKAKEAKQETKSIRDKWDARTWAVVMVGIALLIERIAEWLLG